MSCYHPPNAFRVRWCSLSRRQVLCMHKTWNGVYRIHMFGIYPMCVRMVLHIAGVCSLSFRSCSFFVRCTRPVFVANTFLWGLHHRIAYFCIRWCTLTQTVLVSHYTGSVFRIRNGWYFSKSVSVRQCSFYVLHMSCYYPPNAFRVRWCLFSPSTIRFKFCACTKLADGLNEHHLTRNAFGGW